MKVLVVGKGGREHALVWKLAQSPLVGKVYAAPGNAGTAAIAENVAIGSHDIEWLANYAERNQIDLTVVGPDDALAAGIVDVFQARDRGLPIFGPSQNAAKIESSKIFAKNLMSIQNIPTPPFHSFRKYHNALRHIERGHPPYVVKADGPTRGKGVFVCQTMAQAYDAIHKLMVDRIYDTSADQILIELCLTGREVSAHALCDGITAKTFLLAKDYKRLCDGDSGPNTGGMGTYAPASGITSGIMQDIIDRIVNPALHGMRQLQLPFIGCLYSGLMMTSDGPQVLEFNARFGDTEWQAFSRLFASDLFLALQASVQKRLLSTKIEWAPGFAVCVVLASAGYPGSYQTGFPISGIKEAEKIPGVVVFHAGTALQDGHVVTAGGRVLNVTAVGETLQEARAAAYVAVRCIQFEDMYYREDIGLVN